MEARVIHVGDDTSFAANTVEDTGTGATILLDIKGLIFQDCSQTDLGVPPFPLDILLDREGIVRRINVQEGDTPQEPPAEDWIRWIEELLAE